MRAVHLPLLLYNFTLRTHPAITMLFDTPERYAMLCYAMVCYAT